MYIYTNKGNNKIQTVQWSAETLKFVFNSYTGSTELCHWQIYMFCLIWRSETMYYVFQTSLLPSAWKLH